MTPAINAARKARITHSIHEYEHDSSAESYGLEAAEKMNVEPARVFKTLVTTSGGKDLAVAIVPVENQLDLKLLSKVLGVKKTAMADPKVVQSTTGYVMGGVSPLGQKKALKTVIDDSAQTFTTIFVSAGRRGLEIELDPQDLAKLTRGMFADIAR